MGDGEVEAREEEGAEQDVGEDGGPGEALGHGGAELGRLLGAHGVAEGLDVGGHRGLGFPGLS